MQTANRTALERYFPIASFIAAIVGPKCEVVIHDINDLEHSIIFIENAHNSGRQVGDGSTDLVLKLIQDKRYQHTDYLANYQAKGPKGQTYRSSTYYIKDEHGALIGLMCLNIDISHLDVAASWIQDLLNGGGALTTAPQQPQLDSKPTTEYLQGNVDDMLSHIIESVVSQSEIPMERLSPSEKMEMVKQLNDQGVFLLKGGVMQVAKAFNLSEPTIYRYLQKIKE